MTGPGYLAAMLLAVVLAWAAVAKVWRLPDTVTAFRDLGLPAPMGMALAVPGAELAVGMLLIARPRAGAVAALILLAAFTIFLALRLRAGVAAGCGCFGSTAARPVSAVELVRNGVLGLAALAALAAPGPARPALEDVVAVTSAAAAGLVALALARVHRDVGWLWNNRDHERAIGGGEDRR